MAPRLFRNISALFAAALFAAALVAASPLPAASSAAAAASGSPTLVQGIADGAVTGGATEVTARVFDYEALFDAHSVTKTKIAWYYGQTASSTTDIGLQCSPTGGYSLSGSFTVSNTQSSEQSASASGSKHSYAATNSRVDIYQLVPDNASASYCTNYGNLPGSKKLVPPAWLSGSSWSGSLSTISCGSSSAYYVPGAAHSTFTKASSRTEKIGGGISTPVVGLGISSAYTSSVGLTVRYEWTSVGAACGNNAYPPSAQYLYVG